MSWRGRRRLLVLVLLLGVPLLSAVALGIYVLCDGPEASIAQAWSERLPGRLSIVDLRLTGAGRYRLSGVRLHDDGVLLAEMDRVDVDASLVAGRLHGVELHGMRLHVEALSGDCLRRFEAALGRLAAAADDAPAMAVCTIAIDGVQMLDASGAEVARIAATGRLGGGVEDLLVTLVDLAERRLELRWARVDGHLRGTGSGEVASAGPLAWAGARDLLRLSPQLQDLLPHSVRLRGCELQPGPEGWELRAAVDLPGDGALPLAAVEVALRRSADDLQGDWRLEWQGAASALAGRLVSSAGRRRVHQLTGELPLRALLTLTVLPRDLVPSLLVGWLPERLGVGPGGDLSIDPDGGLSGQLALTWEQGHLVSDLHWHRGALSLVGLDVADRRFGLVQGALQADAERLVLEWDRIADGNASGLLLGRYRAAVAEANRLLPQGSATWLWGERRLTIGARSADGARLASTWEPEAGLRLTGTALPLAPLGSLLGDTGIWRVDGRLDDLILDARGDGITATGAVRGGGIAHERLGLLGLDGLAEFRWDEAWTFAFAFGADSQLRLHRGAQGLTIAAAIELADLAGRIRPAGRLGALSGTVEVDILALASEVAAIPLQVRRLVMRDLALPGWLEGVAGSAVGSLTWWRGQLAGEFTGQLDRGQLLPGRGDLDLVEASPSWRASLAGDLSRGLQLDPLLIRGPDPAAPRYTVGLRGDLAYQDAQLVGSAQLVLDPIELDWLDAWLGRQDPGLALEVRGSAAAVLGLRLHPDGAIELQEGTLLPLADRLRLFGDAIALHGVRGSIRLPQQTLLAPPRRSGPDPTEETP